MIKNFLVLPGLLLSFFMYSCKDDVVTNDPGNNVTFKYPFAINSFWYYSTKNFVTNLRPDSLSVYFPPDTLVGFGDARFIKDTLISQDTLRILRNNHSDSGHTHATIEFFKQTDAGLMRIAFYSDGANFGPHTPHQNPLRYSFNNRSFSNLKELFSYYKNDFVLDNPSDTVLIFDTPPVVALKYPITKNTEWFFKNASNVRMTKKYIDFENVSVQSGIHNCIKIQKLWYIDNSPSPNADLIHYDYFAKEGMIKRDFLIRNITVSNMNGNVIGYIDAKEEAALNIYTLP